MSKKIVKAPTFSVGEDACGSIVPHAANLNGWKEEYNGGNGGGNTWAYSNGDLRLTLAGTKNERGGDGWIMTLSKHMSFGSLTEELVLTSESITNGAKDLIARADEMGAFSPPATARV